MLDVEITQCDSSGFKDLYHYVLSTCVMSVSRAHTFTKAQHSPYHLWNILDFRFDDVF